jgi:hypothetical protein
LFKFDLLSLLLCLIFGNSFLLLIDLEMLDSDFYRFCGYFYFPFKSLSSFSDDSICPFFYEQFDNLELLLFSIIVFYYIFFVSLSEEDIENPSLFFSSF